MSAAPDHSRGWYAIADERVLARMLRELHYEGLLTAHAAELDEHVIAVGGGVHYRFRARRSAWGDLHVVPDTVVREHEGIRCDAERPRSARLVIDAREVLGLDSIVLGNLLEELHNTVAAEAQQCRGLERGAALLSKCSGAELEQFLDGHPKIIGNRGRLGWGWAELEAYAPELCARFGVVWLGARAGLASSSLAHGLSQQSLLERTLGGPAHARLLEVARAASLDPEHDLLFPVHPWQWQRFIRMQYAAELDAGRLVHLGEHGDAYRPRASIRTLSHASRPEAPDLKLSLTIMNTSCYRGIAAQHVAQGGALSRVVSDLAEHDEVLRAAGMVVLRDLGGVHYPLPGQVDAAGPYRYQELLAAIWRESAASRLDPGTLDVAAAALYQQDLVGDSLVRHWVHASGRSPEDWLRALFERTVVPLYHLLCRYGLGVIAHGQNISLLLRDGRPTGMVLRDFHGDVRLSQEPWPERAGLPPQITRSSERRPPSAELVHDLFTGHFVSVLRFVAPLFERDLGVPETRVYALLMEAVHGYTAAHPELRARFDAVPLDRPTMERVCVNRARFTLGYGDLHRRPLPELGPSLTNPLAHASSAG